MPNKTLEITVENELAALRSRLAECPTRDRARLDRRLQELRLRAREGKPVERGLEQWLTDLEVAVARLRESDLQAVPVLSGGVLVGMLTMDNVGELLMLRNALQLAAERARMGHASHA